MEMEGMGMNPLLSPWSTSFRVRINHILTGEGNLIDCTTNTLRRNYHLLKDKQSVNDNLGPQVCGILLDRLRQARTMVRLTKTGPVARTRLVSCSKRNRCRRWSATTTRPIWWDSSADKETKFLSLSSFLLVFSFLYHYLSNESAR